VDDDHGDVESHGSSELGGQDRGADRHHHDEDFMAPLEHRHQVHAQAGGSPCTERRDILQRDAERNERQKDEHEVLNPALRSRDSSQIDAALPGWRRRGAHEIVAATGAVPGGSHALFDALETRRTTPRRAVRSLRLRWCTRR